MTKQTTLIIQNRLGLHARPAALFVQTANQFKSEIQIQKGKNVVNGKSIMGVMTLAAGRGSLIKIKATGVDALKAITALSQLIRNGFGES